MRRLLAILMALALLLVGSPAGAKPKPTATPSPYATQAQLQAEINLVDPHHVITWYFSMYGQAGEAIGLAAPWDANVFLSPTIPVEIGRATVRHEWAHVMQYWSPMGANKTIVDPYGGRDWVSFTKQMQDLAGNSYGMEQNADCITYFEQPLPVVTSDQYGCYAGPVKDYARDLYAAIPVAWHLVVYPGHDLAYQSKEFAVAQVRARLHLGTSSDLYDQATVTAVGNFQTAVGLPLTGIVDRDTWNALQIAVQFAVR